MKSSLFSVGALTNRPFRQEGVIQTCPQALLFRAFGTCRSCQVILGGDHQAPKSSKNQGLRVLWSFEKANICRPRESRSDCSYEETPKAFFGCEGNFCSNMGILQGNFLMQMRIFASQNRVRMAPSCLTKHAHVGAKRAELCFQVLVATPYGSGIGDLGAPRHAKRRKHECHTPAEIG